MNIMFTVADKSGLHADQFIPETSAVAAHAVPVTQNSKYGFCLLVLSFF